MAADDLAPCVNRSSVTLVLTGLVKHVLAFCEERFQVPVPFPCVNIIEYANTFLCFLKKKKISAHEVLILGGQPPWGFDEIHFLAEANPVYLWRHREQFPGPLVWTLSEVGPLVCPSNNMDTADEGPISLNVSKSSKQSYCPNRNFSSDCYKLLHMPQQLCCRGMCKNL